MHDLASWPDLAPNSHQTNRDLQANHRQPFPVLFLLLANLNRSLNLRVASRGQDHSRSNSPRSPRSPRFSRDQPKTPLSAANVVSPSSSNSLSSIMSSPPSGSGGGAAASFLEQTVSLLGSAASYMRLPAIASTVRVFFSSFSLFSFLFFSFSFFSSFSFSCLLLPIAEICILAGRSTGQKCIQCDAALPCLALPCLASPRL